MASQETGRSSRLLTSAAPTDGCAYALDALQYAPTYASSIDNATALRRIVMRWRREKHVHRKCTCNWFVLIVVALLPTMLQMSPGLLFTTASHPWERYSIKRRATIACCVLNCYESSNIVVQGHCGGLAVREFLRQYVIPENNLFLETDVCTKSVGCLPKLPYTEAFKCESERFVRCFFFTWTNMHSLLCASHCSLTMALMERHRLFCWPQKFFVFSRLSCCRTKATFRVPQIHTWCQHFPQSAGPWGWIKCVGIFKASRMWISQALTDCVVLTHRQLRGLFCYCLRNTEW